MIIVNGKEVAGKRVVYSGIAKLVSVVYGHTMAEHDTTGTTEVGILLDAVPDRVRIEITGDALTE